MVVAQQIGPPVIPIPYEAYQVQPQPLAVQAQWVSQAITVLAADALWIVIYARFIA